MAQETDCRGDLSQQQRHESLDYAALSIPSGTILQAGCALSFIATDDEGVSRSDITHEVPSVQRKSRLQRMPNSNGYPATAQNTSFLPGQSLWADAAMLKLNTACAKDSPPKKRFAGMFRFLAGKRKSAPSSGSWNSAFAEFEGKW